MDHHQASNHPLKFQESSQNACSYVKFLNSGVKYHQVSLVHTLTNVLMQITSQRGVHTVLLYRIYFFSWSKKMQMISLSHTVAVCPV